MCPRQGLEPCQQHFSYILFARGNSRLRQHKSRRKKSLWWIPELACIWSARKTLTLPSWRQWGYRGVLRRWWRPTGRCKPGKKSRLLSRNWTYSRRWCFLKKHTRSSFTWEALRGYHGYTYHWTSGQKPHLTKNGKRIDWNISNCVPFVVLGLSTSSSNNIHAYFFIIFIEGLCIWREQTRKIPQLKEVEVRVRSYGETRWTDLQKPKTKIKMKDAKKHRAIYCMTCRIVCRRSENFVDESSPLEPRWNPAPEDRDTSSSPHELRMESRAEEVPDLGKHSVYTHFPKDPNCEICLKTKMTRASCRRLAGTVVHLSDNFGNPISADHKILSEESESRNNLRYAVVVQDLATQWLQSYLCKTKTSQETHKS